MQAFIDALNSVRDFMDLGGEVLWGIMLVTFLMWMFMIERIWYLYFIAPGRLVAVQEEWNSRADTSSWYARRIREALISRTSDELNQNVLYIKTLIAICPLLGLLGTVTGMIQVFDVMALTGTGNARAMASGVSKATVPTMAGMVAALSGIFLSSRIERKAEAEAELLEDELKYH